MQSPDIERHEALDVPVSPVVVPSPTGRSFPILPVAIAIVAVLGGSALFMSGYSMGRQTAVEPGTPVGEDAAFRPFWDTYHTITDRYAGGRGRPRRDRPGRHPGHDRVARGPVFLVPHVRGVPR